MAVKQDESVGAVWAALGVRPAEAERVRALFVAAFLVGLALVSFFSGSNALFLDEVGADRLAWVYLANAPLVIVAGLGYAAWSRRAPTTTVLTGSIWFLVASVAALWAWAALTDGPAAPFALAVWFRFLFIFGFLGLWEVASAVFDVRQAKRLFPAVALGAMLAFMLGGAVVSAVAAAIGTTQLIAISAACFALYALAFRRAVDGADFDAADATEPATPREIVSDRFSRNLALMRSITILLIFVTEFIFYGQVEANLSGDEAIARFLGIFLAGATLAMVVVTATMSARYISRFGVGIGLATMPAGLLIAAIALVLWGSFVGVDRGFFVLAIVANVLNTVLANAIETPVGAVLYQPMPVERRMPVRVAVDGWLGSLALVVVGLLLLGFDALDVDGVLPFVWLLACIGAAGIVLARSLHRDYRDALAQATTLAFSGGRNDLDLLGSLDEAPTMVQPGLLSLALEIDDDALDVLVPELLTHPSDDVAAVAVAASMRAPQSNHAGRLAALAEADERDPQLRADALRALHHVDRDAADRLARRYAQTGATGAAASNAAVTAQALALQLDDATTADRVAVLARSDDRDDRLTASRIFACCPRGVLLHHTSRATLTALFDDPDDQIATTAMRAAGGRVDDKVAPLLVRHGRTPERRRPCVEALATGGDTALASIEEVIGELPDSYVIDLVDDVYATSTRRPVLLHQFLEPQRPSRVRRAGFDAVRRADIDLPATVPRMARDDVELADRLISARRRLDDVPASTERTLLVLALDDEYAAVRRTIWSALRVRGHAGRLEELEVFVARDEDDDRANAVEALDGLLDRATRDLVVPILEPADLDEATELGRADLFTSATEACTALADDPRMSASTRRLAQHHLTPETTMSEILERVLALKRVDIFSTLSYELLVELAEVAEIRLADRGEQIIEKGSLGDELFAIVDGEVAIGDSEIRLRAGTVFGELAVLAPGPRNATVTAMTESSMLVLSRNTLLALAERRPSVMAEIARVLASRLQATGAPTMTAAGS